MKHVLSTKTLPKFKGGVVAIAFDDEIKRAVQDCHDRGNVKTARKVQLTIALTPIPDERGVAEIGIQAHVGSKLPTRKTNVVTAGSMGNGDVVFSDASDDHRQGTLDEVGSTTPDSDG